MIDPRDPAPHHYETEPEAPAPVLPYEERHFAATIKEAERQTAMLEQIRNGVSVVAVELLVLLLLIFIGLAAAGS